jgi:hypothetical protein
MSDVLNIEHFLNDLEEERENVPSLKNFSLSNFEPQLYLKKWIDYHLQKFNVTVFNFRDDFKVRRGEFYSEIE